MAIVVIEPPEPLVSLELAKAHLRVDDDDSNILIGAYIAAVSEHLDGPDGWLGRAIGEQTLEWTTAGFPATTYLRLPFEPVQTIESVHYVNDAGVDTVWPDADYTLSRGALSLVYGGSWPAGRVYADAVRIRWVAGYSTVPAAIVAAALIMVGDMFANRESSAPGGVGEVPMAASVSALLAPFRNVRV